ncbi:hypothetical protein U6A24_19515 [Aquimarina gracilis]|uniref:Uncharacterized protein n=1 Tax=Aquimarina gracilis TaxID=874422 RepID=A0ABU6A0T5_9FLAO|nr:hypothetical protein [Aquimarina gracilis]MEB3347675.1 hypothetical protein [Aquimarina gracilis]
METSKNLISEITKITTNIETNYPELYKFIEEQPITIPSSNNPKTDEQNLRDYLDSLKQLLQHHLDTHNNKA